MNEGKGKKTETKKKERHYSNQTYNDSYDSDRNLSQLLLQGLCHMTASLAMTHS